MSASATILLYHRVATPASDPHAICVSEDRFAEQLRLLVDRYHPLPLTEVVRGLDAHDLPANAVSLTFDDGYGDNAQVAFPLLREYGVPATIFVATANLGTDVEFWWDRLQSIFLTAGSLPRRLSLWIGRRPFYADLGEDREYGPAEVRRHRDWMAALERPPTRRHQTYLRLFGRIQRLRARSANATLERLESWAQVPASTRSSRRCLSNEELTAMRGSGLIEVGAHTAHHPRLSKLRRADRIEEIVVGREDLVDLVGPIRHFAYPFGDDVDSAALVRAAGFTSACTTKAGSATARSDRYRLPRHRVGDYSAATLQAQMKALDSAP